MRRVALPFSAPILQRWNASHNGCIVASCTNGVNMDSEKTARGTTFAHATISANQRQLQDVVRVVSLRRRRTQTGVTCTNVNVTAHYRCVLSIVIAMYSTGDTTGVAGDVSVINLL